MCEGLTRSCLERIEERIFDPRVVLYRSGARHPDGAEELDKRAAVGALYGLPVGIKDVIDTFDMPATQNSPLISPLVRQGRRLRTRTPSVRWIGSRQDGYRGIRRRRPQGADAQSSRCRTYAGRLIVGVSCRRQRSSRSLSFGTQTGGSLIRPASFNGVYAMKPSYGIVNTEGVKHYAPTLDTVGWYGRCVGDLDSFKGVPASGRERSNHAAGPYRIGVCRAPMWERAEEAGRLALGAAAERLARAGHEICDLELPVRLSSLYDAVEAIRQWEAGFVYLAEYLEFGPRLHKDCAVWSSAQARPSRRRWCRHTIFPRLRVLRSTNCFASCNWMRY